MLISSCAGSLMKCKVLRVEGQRSRLHEITRPNKHKDQSGMRFRLMLEVLPMKSDIFYLLLTLNRPPQPAPKLGMFLLCL